MFARPTDAEIVDSARFMADQGTFGIVWLDADAVVCAAFGELATFVKVGAPVTESLLVLIGQEELIASLKQSRESQRLVIPNVAVMAPGGDAPPPRMNVAVHWRPASGDYLVVLGRAVGLAQAEEAVENEIRKRRIADAELARVNAELEEFAYVISHDLKAPLRALRYYSEDVAEALSTEPPDAAAARAAAASIAIATRRMGNMLSGLLEFARIGRRHEAIETVDTAALVDDILANTGRPEGMRLARAGAWPTIRTAPAPLDLVLRNLIDNAIKHHDLAAGTIAVSARDAGDALEFDITDDGPGIAREWQQAIFEPFRRIDDTKAPESSGIGLALVKRTIEHAGGRIEVVSDPERQRGTTFRVTWPKGG